MKNNIFYKQADLLIRILPYISEDEDFALHGGTAINFFIRDMPRLSVDIDLTYLPISNLEDSLNQIGNKLQIIANKIKNALPSVRIDDKRTVGKNHISKLFVNYQGVIIKIEPNQVIRGTLSDCEERELSKKAEEVFEKSVIVKTLSFSDLYGSKICAALDRQHPRDIYDIKQLLDNEGITDEVRKSFLVYLISHNRPMSELIKPRLADMRAVFEKEFNGMTLVHVKYDDLENTRNRLIEKINNDITNVEKEFLISFKKGTPKWDILDIKGAKELPAVKWKLLNLEKMDTNKHKTAIEQLMKVLNVPCS